MKKFFPLIIGLFVLLFLYYGIWIWGICRTYVEPGYSLRLKRNTGDTTPSASYASDEQKGVQEQMRGPGRHFFNPWTYETKLVRDVTIPPGSVGIVTSKVGRPITEDRFLAEDGEKGTQARVLTPGRWRLNDHGIAHEIARATEISPGYVGVQIQQDGPGKGVLDAVLPPGYHNVNPKAVRVEEVEIGYREFSLRTELDRNGRPREGTGVSFPTADGFNMWIDLTVVWGLLPENAPRIIREYGNIDAVEDKIIAPQIDSACKLNGSRYSVRQFILGEDREAFQDALATKLREVGAEKGVEFLLVLVRGIYPPEEVRRPIQLSRLAEEERQSLQVRLKTDEVAARLEEAKKKVEITIRDYRAESLKMVAAEQATGEKKAAEIEAETERLVAELEAQIAAIEAQRTTELGQARADVTEAQRKADADRYRQQIRAYGDGRIYNLARFAEALPESLQLEFRYAGPGTFWTDMGRSAGTAAGSSPAVEAAARLLLERAGLARKPGTTGEGQ